MFYSIAYYLSKFIIKVFYRETIIGKEKVPKEGFLVCANHSKWSDPFYVASLIGKKPKLYTMAKKELFKNRIAAWAITKAGGFPVKRGEADFNSIRTSLSVLKRGDRLLVFPEGTRYGNHEAKAGVGMFALRTSCPVLPVYISVDKRFLHKTYVVCGDPYYPEIPTDKPSTADYMACAEEILNRIYQLKETIQ